MSGGEIHHSFFFILPHTACRKHLPVDCQLFRKEKNAAGCSLSDDVCAGANRNCVVRTGLQYGWFSSHDRNAELSKRFHFFGIIGQHSYGSDADFM